MACTAFNFKLSFTGYWAQRSITIRDNSVPLMKSAMSVCVTGIVDALGRVG